MSYEMEPTETPTVWNFISSPPNWWAIYSRKSEVVAFPIVAWRIVSDNRDQGDIQRDPFRSTPYGEPMIMEGDGQLGSCYGQGNRKDFSDSSVCYDFRDGWEFQYADYIPKIKNVLRKPSGDVIYWEVLQ